MMTPIINIAQLNEAIVILEIERNEKLWLLKQECKNTFETLKPLNILKNTFSQFAKQPEFKGDILNTTLSIATGYISKKLTIGNSHNPIKNLFGELLQIGITSIMAKDSSILNSILKLFSSKKNKANDENENNELESNY